MDTLPYTRLDEALIQYRREHASLVRLSRLLVADSATAESVVVDAFVRTAGPARRPCPRPGRSQLVKAVVAAARRRRRGSSSGPTSSSVLAAMTQLPDRQRECVVLRHYEGLSDVEIAAAVGGSVSSARGDAARGLLALQGLTSAGAKTMQFNEAMRAAFEEHRRSEVAAPDVDVLARHIARHDRGPRRRTVSTRRRAPRRLAFVAAIVAVATIAVAAFAALHGDKDTNVADPARRFGADAATATVAATATTVAGAPAASSPSPEPTTQIAAPIEAPIVPTPTETTPPPEEEIGEPEEPSEPPERYASFTAFFTFGSSTYDPPYEAYFGTAPGGSAIEITSAYGSATTVADPDGYWHAAVEFPTAPVGAPFAVTITNAAGSETFEFTRMV